MADEPTEAKPAKIPRLILCSECREPFFRKVKHQMRCSAKCSNRVLSRRFRARHKPKGEENEPARG